MTEIAIFLTAIPLAVALAMLLNTLLDRRLAAVTHTLRRSTTSKLRGLLVLLALGSLATTPARAANSPGANPQACAEFECSLVADAERVEELWRRAPRGVVLVSQDSIPTSVTTGDGDEALDTSQVVVDGDRTSRPRPAHADSTSTRP